MIGDVLLAARDFEASRYVPLICDHTRIGWLRPAAAERLAAWPRVFSRAAAGLSVAEALASAPARTQAIDEVILALYSEGAITGWRDERYAVVARFDGPPLFHVERAAARYFGVTTYAAHANGYCGEGVRCEMWLARRSPAKPIDPGMLDNLVGGGMTAGVAPLDTVVREAWEEAGIPAALGGRAVAAGTARLLREVPEGVQSELIFVHDLKLPREFEPRNQDGEVAGFQRVPITDIAAMLVRTGASITLDARLVMLSFLMRRGYVSCEDTAGVLDLAS